MTKHSPKRTYLVAVYGTLLAGERNEKWAADALSRTPCLLAGSLHDTGYGFPAFVPSEGGKPVRAELLEVSRETILRLDVLEGVPELYRRRTVPAVLPCGEVFRAIVYVMNRLPTGAKTIPSGDWRRR